MVEIGRFNTLTVVKIVDFGIYLDGGERGEILMPKEYVPDNCFPDDEIKAFDEFCSSNGIIYSDLMCFLSELCKKMTLSDAAVLLEIEGFGKEKK